MLRRVTLVRNDVSEELIASIFMMTKINELGRALKATNNRSTLRLVATVKVVLSSPAFCQPDDVGDTFL
jgi:hypothetical protein